MSITIPGNSQLSQSVPTTSSATPARKTAEREPDADPVAASATDKVTLNGQSAQPATYADPRAKTAQTAAGLQAMLDESNAKAQQIIDLILPLIQQQGLNLSKVASGEQHLQIDPATIAKAKAAIADDGEFGVQKVAERILSFVKAAIGDDPTKLATMRAAVEKGFKQATDILGGVLPDISQKTHTAIMAEFDRWENEGIPSGDTVTLAATDKKTVGTD